jgi:hypothetical protein
LFALTTHPSVIYTEFQIQFQINGLDLQLSGLFFPLIKSSSINGPSVSLSNDFLDEMHNDLGSLCYDDLFLVPYAAAAQVLDPFQYSLSASGQNLLPLVTQPNPLTLYFPLYIYVCMQ